MQSASRPAETGACYKYANIAGGACSAAGSEVLAGPDDAPQWVLEQVPGQRGRYYIRQSVSCVLRAHRRACAVMSVRGCAQVC